MNYPKIINWLFIGMVGLACSCQKESVSMTAVDSDTEIKPQASIGDSMLTRADLIGTVIGITFPVSTEKIFAMTAFCGDSVPTSFTPNSRINNDYAHTDETATCYFDKPKYYPEVGKLYFYGFSPVVHSTYTNGEDTTAPQIIWNLTGKEDIMWAKNDSGIAKNPVKANQEQPDLHFVHRCTQFQFKLVKGENFQDNAKVNYVRINGVPNTCTMNLITGELTWGDPDQYLEMTDPNMYVLGEVLPNALLVQPGLSTLDLCINVMGSDFVAQIPLDPALHQGEAGYSTLLTLTFSGLGISYSTALVDWVNVGTVEGTI